MTEPKDSPKKKAKKKRAEPVYVPVAYPVWLGAASFAWAVAGWLIAAFAPRLAFVPLAGAVHLLFPAVTVGLLGANLYFAVRSLLRGAHVLRLALVTGVEVALFTTLFFQLYAHVGAEVYDAAGPTSPWQWFAFSAAHAFRAGDVFDAVEALGWGIQPVKHTSPLVGLFVVAYHVVVDVFFLGLVWAVVGRVREALLADDEFRGMLVRFGLGAFAVWFVTWVVVAFFVRPWRTADVVLWWVENVLRVVDFADVMESFGLRLHTLPREGIVGWLTVLCRLWIGIGLAVALTRKRKPPPRRVLTPPGVEARSYWRLRVGALAGMAVLLFAVGLAGWLAAGSSADALVAAVKDGPDDRAESALRALRRMGPSANATVEPLVAARADASPAVRDGITRTLGYLGTSAAPHLRAVALKEPAESAGIAVDALAEVGGPAAPDLVAVWTGTTDDAVKTRADAAIRSLGGTAVSPLIEGFTPENAYGHYVWLGRLDPNWRMRGTANPTARACHELEDLKSRVGGGDPAAAVAAMTRAQDCGTAAKELLEVAYDRLGDSDQGLQTAAAGIITAATGPAEMPKVLTLVAGTAPGRSLSPVVVNVLRDPAMWPPAVVNDPVTLPALMALARHPDGFAVALSKLGQYGSAASPATLTLVSHVADADADTRKAVRATLARVRPGWKDDPVLTDAVPTFLFGLPKLPPAEADELYAAIKPLTPGQAEALLASVEREIRAIEKRYLTNPNLTRTEPEKAQNAKTVDEVFDPIERLGPKVKEALPGLKAIYARTLVAGNNQVYPQVNQRVGVILEQLGAPTGESAGRRMATLGFGPEGQAYLRSRGADALPYLRGLLASRREAEISNGLVGVEALGRTAAPLVPQMMELLTRDGKGFGEPKPDVPRLGRALTAADPGWWGRPETVPALGRLLQPPAFFRNERRPEDQWKLDFVATIAPATAPKVAAEMIRVGVVDRETREAFDKVAPTWRADPAVKAAAPEMAGRIGNREYTDRAEEALLDLGPVGVEAVAATLAGLPDEAVAGTFMDVKGVLLRDHSLVLLTKFDPPAEAAVPALLALAARPKLYHKAVPKVIEALDKAAPGWAADPAHAAAVKAAGDALLARSADGPAVTGFAARFGNAVGPELVRLLEAARTDMDAIAVLQQMAAAGPAAKGALPALTKRAADQGGRVRSNVIDTIGKVAAGDPAAVSSLTPLLLDPNQNIRDHAVPALDRIDPKWRTSAAAKAVLTTMKGQFAAAPDRQKRMEATELFGRLGSEAVPTLCPVVLDVDNFVQSAAARALDRADPKWRESADGKKTADAALKQLSNADAKKRHQAIGALMHLRPAGAVAALERVAANDADRENRATAERVLTVLRRLP